MGLGDMPTEAVLAAAGKLPEARAAGMGAQFVFGFKVEIELAGGWVWRRAAWELQLLGWALTGV